MYGQARPPQWNISNIQEEVALIVGTADPITTYKDVSRIRRELTGVKQLVWYEFEAGHLTYMFGKKVPHMEVILKFLRNQL